MRADSTRVRVGVGTIQGVASSWAGSTAWCGKRWPVPRKRAERKKPKLAAAVPFIDARLEADRQAPRKQRHTAHRIYQRRRRELPAGDASESTVRR